jgi:hypothetical protein
MQRSSVYRRPRDRNALRDAIEAQEAALATEPDKTQRGYMGVRIVNLRELAEAL